ncbi:MAG TPA: hypothetical protein VJ456_11495 [Acidimicrobiia bacterium]|nr:hypothetical protein [Acidimicrobiia bacterium]
MTVQQQRKERRPDPWSMLTEGMRQISRLELADIRRGLENFTSPSAAGLLDSFGRTRGERVEKMAALLRNSSEADVEEMGTVFGLAMAKLAEEQATGSQAPPPAARREEQPRRRRGETSAEWRRERRGLSPAS